MKTKLMGGILILLGLVAVVFTVWGILGIGGTKWGVIPCAICGAIAGGCIAGGMQILFPKKK